MPGGICYCHGVRTVGILVALGLFASTAHADRQTVTWVGLSLAGTSYANTTNQDANMNAGARISLTFEDAPIALPPAGLFDHDARIVPELFAGFYMNDTRARSQIGAGLRAEIQLARNQTDGVAFHMRAAIYAAARLKISGPNADGGAEFMIGEYLIGDRANRRFGWEGGLGMIKRPELDATQSPELEALVNIFVGF
jgi:hypothetical protein